MIETVNTPRCQYRRSDGRQCGAPAHRNHRYCEVHKNWWDHAFRELRGVEPIPGEHNVEEDDEQVEAAFGELIHLMLTDQIDDARAGVLLYALQSATTDQLQLWYCD